MKRELLAPRLPRRAGRRDHRLVDLGPPAERLQAEMRAAASASASGTRSTPSTCCRSSRSAAATQTDPETLRPRRRRCTRDVGMHPLVLSHEIDGFVADRLLEALWREALWLVNDGIATVTEIDDAIRYGAGLRWASMGTFLTYRIAGGEAGMRHFMEQFGPALAWPWSKLTDVPELTDALLDRIVEQSDAQAAGRSVRELERLRDDCLVAVIQGAARPGRRRRRRARALGASAARAAPPRRRSATARSTPRCACTRRPCRADWIDYNGHVNDSRYLLAFGEATDALLRGDRRRRRSTWRPAAATTRSRRTSAHLGAAYEGDRLRRHDAGARRRREAPAALPRARARRRRRAARDGRADAAARRRARAARRTGAARAARAPAAHRGGACRSAARPTRRAARSAAP